MCAPGNFCPFHKITIIPEKAFFFALVFWLNKVKSGMLWSKASEPGDRETRIPCFKGCVPSGFMIIFVSNT